MYGIHNTEILIAEVSEADMKEMGLRTGQCERLLRKINELKGLAEELAEDEPVVEDTKEVKKNWKRRQSIASSMEYYENIKVRLQPPPPRISQ